MSCRGTYNYILHDTLPRMNEPVLNCVPVTLCLSLLNQNINGQPDFTDYKVVLTIDKEYT